MIKLLITGFQHSGTTMLHQLIKAHPQVGFIENEEGYIEYDKTKEWILMHAKNHSGNLKEKVWGEKLPWGNRIEDIKGKRPISFINKWLKYFENDARVLHILRHPFDVCLSLSNGNTINMDNLKLVLESTSKVINHINKDDRCFTIVYEELVNNPEFHLTNIFEFLKISTETSIIENIINKTELKFGCINIDRAYAYKNKDDSMNIDYDSIIVGITRRL